MVPHSFTPLYPQYAQLTCNGITIINIFLSFGERKCLINVHPVPIRIIVMNKTDPRNLQKTKN